MQKRATPAHWVAIGSSFIAVCLIALMLNGNQIADLDFSKIEIGSIGVWVSGTATFSAVWAALSIANRQSTLETARENHRILIGYYQGLSQALLELDGATSTRVNMAIEARQGHVDRARVTAGPSVAGVHLLGVGEIVQFEEDLGTLFFTISATMFDDDPPDFKVLVYLGGEVLNLRKRLAAIAQKELGLPAQDVV